MATRAGFDAKRPAAVRSRSSANFELAVKASLDAAAGSEGQEQEHGQQILRRTFLDGADAGLLGARRYGRSVRGCVLGGAGDARVSLGDVHGGGGCGLVKEAQKKECCGAEGATYGAERSIFLLRIGSDILADQ
jgi:hypothetical protein